MIEDFLAHCRQQKFFPGYDIVFQGDKSEFLYYLVEGSATVSIEDEKGREIIISYLYAGDFFGEMGLFDNQQLRSAGVRAKSTCKVAEISYVKFGDIAYAYPEILFAIVGQLAKRLRQTSQKAMDLAFIDVTGRIARTLLQLCQQPDAKKHPNGIQISLTRYEMSQIVGCSREMVGRVYKSLEEKHILSAKGKLVLVHNGRVFGKSRLAV